jgi:hypothetical protein
MKRTILALAIAGLSVAAYASPPPGGGPPTPIDVNVTNPVLPVEVSNANPVPVVTANQPVMIRKFTEAGTEDAVYTVPVDKTFVLEHVNCTSLSDVLFVGIFQGELQTGNFVYSVPLAGETASILIADGATRIYFAPGSELKLRIYLGVSGGQTTCTLSGYTTNGT